MIALKELLDAPDFQAALVGLLPEFRARHALPPLHQLGVVVPAVEAAAGELEAGGLGPFFIAAGRPAFWRERGEEKFFQGKMGLAAHQGIEVELLEPGRGSDFYGRSLDQAGRPLVHHLGFLAPELEPWAEKLAADGFPVYVRGRLQSGPLTTDFVYLDTMDQLGFIIEFISWRFLGRFVKPPAGLYHFLGRLEKLSGKRSLPL